jgi:hypothetical protein
MEQDQFQSYEEGESYKPGHTVNVIPALDRINARLNAADQEALAQVQRNNRTRVENSKSAGQDLIALSKMSKTLTDALVERQKGINEDQNAEGLVAGQQLWEQRQLDTSEYDAGTAAAKQQDSVVQDVASDVLGDSGENYEAAASLSKATTHYAVGQRQGYAMAAVAGIDDYLDQKAPPQNYNSSAEYAAARAKAQKEFYKEAGLANLKPAFLAKTVYPEISKSNAKAMTKWRKRFAIEDSAKTQDELFSTFSATKDIPSLLSALRNTVDGQGNPLGYRGAWSMFDARIVEMRQAGMISDNDIESMKSQPIPGDPKGRTYGQLHEAKFENIQRQVDAQQRADWSNSQADRQMEFQKAEQELVDSFIDGADADGYTDDQLDVAIDTLRKTYGMSSSKLETLKANTVDAETRDKQEEQIQDLIKMNLLTPERLQGFDPKLQSRYASVAGQTAKLRKDTNNFETQNKAIKEKVEFLVKLDPMSAADPAVGLMVAKMQREYQEEVNRLMLGGDTNAADNALINITSKLDSAVSNMGDNPQLIKDFYNSQTLGKMGTPSSSASAKAQMIDNALANDPTAVSTAPLISKPELEKIVKNYGQPGFDPGFAAREIGRRLNVDPLTVLNKQLEVHKMDALPPTPAMEVVNKLTPQQQQLLQKYKTPERSARGFGGTGTFKPEIVPHGLGQNVEQSATKYNIPPSILAALLGKESGYQKRWMGTAANSAGAVGIAQIIPRWHPTHTPGLDPAADIDYAAKYLREIMDGANQTGGPVDIETALYMYNAGPYAGSYPNSTENAEYTPWIMKEAYKYGYGSQSLQNPQTMRSSIAAQIPR